VVSFITRLLYPMERAPGTHWVVSRDNLDMMVKRYISVPTWNQNPIFRLSNM